MAKYLINTTEVYRVDTEEEATQLIEEAKKNDQYVLSKYSSVQKERKSGGEVIDTWFRITLTKVFDDEKEPENNIEVIYESESAF